MLDTAALLALGSCPSERAHFAERCYASGCQALDYEQNQRAALMFGAALLTRFADVRAWRGLALAVRELGLPVAAEGLCALGHSLSGAQP
ncbi:MAG: hypothetical protein QM756_36945 [Polyangiaceae bacterium]